MSTNQLKAENSTERITSPYVATDEAGQTYAYYRCEACGAECVGRNDFLHAPECGF